MYQPNALAVLTTQGTPYLFTASEGDVREHDAFNEATRVGSLRLNPSSFSIPVDLLIPAQLGRLNVTTTLGDNDKNNEFETLLFIRSKIVQRLERLHGGLVYDSKNQLEQHVVDATLYDDGRSDDKGVEPEGLALGVIGKKQLVFIGLERATWFLA